MPRLSAKQSTGPGLNALIYAEIQQLRRWVASFPRRPSQKETMAWIEKRFDKKIAQYTISRYLSSRYAHVDTVPLGDASLQATRPRVGQWPTLERMLYQWHQEQPPGIRGAANELLQAKALEIWMQHQEAREGEPSTTPRPALGASWVRMFKERHGLKRRNSRGKPLVMATAATEGDAAAAALEEHNEAVNGSDATPEADSEIDHHEDAEEPAEAEYITNEVTPVRHVVEAVMEDPPTTNDSHADKPTAAADDGHAPGLQSPLALSAGVTKLAELIQFVQTSRDTDKDDLLLLQSLSNKWDALMALERARARQRETVESFHRLHGA
ncbi:hypothetical protein GGTG_12984 [Gaeumannomyces tritici R3-111a-1]|uniref:HTH CENPB-type domain-containing protein n=1 Tax=Gaeumannomyces tritici (strain R3-111a-1) TaxID=644352 RepID=J3PHK4_GAET3|nr:hypothetical protein GGTG_12984 [Gaeumannomyces tritici R3-111a-1]EJT69365.1 hypothetical protein GGTG_12984 [Gaeumannomyces tritici R3-111a-1]